MKRTASVKSQNFSTCSFLEYQAFLTLWDHVPIIKTNFIERLKTIYNDNWRKYTRKCLKSIDYLREGISDEVLDEISYKLEIINCPNNNHYIKAGQFCNEIIMIWCGKMEVSIENIGGRQTYIDTLTACSTIGAYSAMSAEDHMINAHSKTSWKLLILKYEILEQLREQYNELDTQLWKYEDYIDTYGIPYWDYHIFRETDEVATPLLKFQQGILRIIRIIKAYRTNKLTDLLAIIQEDIRKKKKDKLKRKQKQLLKKLSTAEESKNEVVFSK